MSNVVRTIQNERSLLEISFILIDDVITAVDVKCFTRDEARRIMGKKGRRNTYIVDADEALGRRLFFCLFEQRIKFRNSGRGPRRQWTGRDACTRIPFGPSLPPCNGPHFLARLSQRPLCCNFLQPFGSHNTSS